MKPPIKSPAKARSAASATRAQERFLQGLALHQAGQFSEARAVYQEVLLLQPRHFDALHLSGLIAYQAGDIRGAVALIGEAIKVNPSFPAAQNNQGVALRDLKQPEAALACFERAVRLKSDYAEAYNNRALVLRDLKQLEAALASLDKAVALKPDYAAAHNNRGLTLQDLGRHLAALESLSRAIACNAGFVEAWYNLGNVLHELKRYPDALQSLSHAIALRPDYCEAYSNRGNVLRDLKQYPAALESYDQATRINAGYAEAWCNRGNVLLDLMKLDAALDSYGEAIARNPDLDSLYGTWLYTRMRLCEWGGLDEHIARLFEKITRHERATPAFPVLALTGSRAMQRAAAGLAVAMPPLQPALPGISERSRREKIRVGYFSADLHDHATAYLMAELFERHDKSRFELIAFSFGPDRDDTMRRRVAAAFDRFIDVRERSDREVALLSRELEVDIAVDLKGLTQDARPGIFAWRAAPVQVNYLGYPGTMGADFIDYLIADSTVIPEESRQYFSEKIAYLPYSYQVNDRGRVISDREFTREEMGLPREGFVFCCFNNNYKITPATFDGWMRVLERVPGSVLWLLEDNPTAARNLRREAEQRGVEAARLVFARRLAPAEHLARHGLADLFIDTLPYNAHTTASDALWAGLPVLTCIGDAFAGRVAASLLHAIGLPELITTTAAEYEAMAIELATHPEALAALREKLARQRLSAPLFDTERFARHIEDIFTQMHERSLAGLAPDHLPPPTTLIPPSLLQEQPRAR